jgi:hypothetical protein
MRATLGHQLSLETCVPDDRFHLCAHHAEPVRAFGDESSAGAPAAPVASLRDVQRVRLHAEAERLARLERQLANLQLILKTDQARLAIDRLRFAVHGLCGAPLREELPLREPRRLVRVK